MEWIIGILIFIIVVSILGNTKGDEEKKKGEEILQQQKAAEEYILRSGDNEAIKQLMLMKANPSSYQHQFQRAASDNNIMRTAFGVFTGFIAADLVTSAIHQHQLEESLANFETELDKIGGIDNFHSSEYGQNFSVEDSIDEGGDDIDLDLFS